MNTAKASSFGGFYDGVNHAGQFSNQLIESIEAT